MRGLPEEPRRVVTAEAGRIADAPDPAAICDLGPCCRCGETGPSVRIVVTIERRAPIRGTGWSCHVCGARDGALAVICEACEAWADQRGLALGSILRTFCWGRPVDGERRPLSELPAERVCHDRSAHSEIAIPPTPPAIARPPGR